MSDAYTGPDRRGSARRNTDREEILQAGHARAVSVRAIKGLAEPTPTPVRAASEIDAYRLIITNPRLARVAEYMEATQAWEEKRTPINRERLDRAAQAVIASEKDRPTPTTAARAVRVQSAGVNGTFIPQQRGRS